MKISVVIATYNQVEYIERCVESVLSQTYKDFDIVIIDDGSSDGTDKIVEKILIQYPDKIKAIRFLVNKGQAESWNSALEVVSGELVSFLEGDDIWYPNKLEAVVKSFGDPEKFVMHQHNLWRKKRGEVSQVRFCDTLILGNQLQEFGNRGDLGSLSSQAPASALTFSATVLKRVGPIPKTFQYSADAYLKRTAICFGRVSGLDECLGEYWINDKGQSYQKREYDTELFLRQLLRPALNEFYKKNNVNVQLEELPRPSSMAFLNLRDGDRILIVRSVPPGRVKEVVAEIKQQNAGITIDLVVQRGMEGEFESTPCDMLFIEPGMMNQDSISDETRRLILKNNYDCVLLPYLNESGMGYENIDRVIISLGISCPVFGVGLKGHLTVKKYRTGLAPESTTGRVENSWELLRDKYRGRRAFVVGNGPSLTFEDLDKLKNEITFASNKIYLAFDSTDWRPSYYTVADQLVAANNYERIRTLDLPMLMPTSLKSFSMESNQTLWYRESGFNSYLSELSPEELKLTKPRFARDAVYPIHGGYSVIYHQLQLAWHMGIREIYLIGLDFSFSVPKGRTIDERFDVPEYRNALVSDKEVNHFHPDYRSPGETWSMPRLDLQACAFRAALDAFTSEGGSLLNASRKTALEELELVNFDKLFSEDE